MLEPVVVHDDGRAVPVRRVPTAEPTEVAAHEPSERFGSNGSPTVRVPLGRLAHARAGDKGGNSNVGLWTDDVRWPWLRSALTTELVRELLPEARDLRISRHELPELRAVHFVFHGLLGDGCTSNGRLDALGKSVGEFLRSRTVEVPAAIVTTEGRAA